MGALPGVNYSFTTWISANGRFISRGSENGLIDPLLGVPEFQAVVWKHGQINNLGTLDGGQKSLATAANSRGQVSGLFNNLIPDPFSMFCLLVCSTTQIRAFLWQGGVMQDLGTLSGPDAQVEAMSERGQIVGTSYTSSTPNPGSGIPTIDPFLWENGSMVDIGTLGGTNGLAHFVNSRGQVVGVSNLAGDSTSHPFLWSNGKLMDLGTLGGDSGEAFWINEAGDVVGKAYLSGSQAYQAFLWKHGAMSDLGTPSNDPCSVAYVINSNSQRRIPEKRGAGFSGYRSGTG